jgi:hypothetical protein
MPDAPHFTLVLLQKLLSPSQSTRPHPKETARVFSFRIKVDAELIKAATSWARQKRYTYERDGETAAMIFAYLSRGTTPTDDQNYQLIDADDEGANLF